MSRARTYWFALAVWFVLLVIAVCLGALREQFVVPAFGEPTGHIIGTIAFLGVMLAIMVFFVRWIRPYCSFIDLWLIGLFWLTLTIAFEFLFFHFAAGKPWEVLLADYNIFRGRIWVLVPATELFGPPIIGRFLRRRISTDEERASFPPNHGKPTLSAPAGHGVFQVWAGFSLDRLN